MADPVLTAVSSGSREILLSWTYGSSADFQVFWKSSSPAGQNYVLLGTTNGFSYTVGSLSPILTYYFYIRANIGESYYYSNVVELFVSCGKGVVLDPTPPDPPPAQPPIYDIYACDALSSIYARSKEVGNFATLGEPARSWTAMAAAASGNVYAGTGNGDIYKQTAGSGAFNALGLGSLECKGLAVAPNGDVYYSIYNGHIYKQSGGAGAFSDIWAVTRFWWGMCAATNGDIYAVANGVDLYKQTGGVGDFVAKSVPAAVHFAQESKAWTGVCVDLNNNIYLCMAYFHKIYKQTNGTGGWAEQTCPDIPYYALCASASGNIYAGGYDSDIAMQTAGTGSFVGLSQTSRRWTGLAARRR